MLGHLASLFYLSFPAVGNWVHYEAIYEGQPVIIEKSVLGHDPQSDSFEIHSVIQYEGSVIKDEILTLPRTFLYSPESIQNVLKNCVRREGALGTVTLQAQTLPVCEFFHEDSQLTEMIGPVPFGLLRFQVYLEGESFLDFHLTRFTL